MSDSDLLKRLRRRAYDPAARLDDVYVPGEWLKRTYGDEAARKSMRWMVGPAGEEDVVLKAGAPEAVEFFKDVPQEPPYPPVRISEVIAAEQRMGRRLPELLKRLYTEVANGGFGPMYGILGIARSGPQDDRDTTAVEEYLAHPELHEPLGFPLIAAGCSVRWYVSLTEPGNPVHLFDWDGWDWPDQDPPTVAIHYTAPTLAGWLGRWADGHDVWPRT